MIANMCLVLILALANDIDCTELEIPSIYELPFLATVYDTALCEPNTPCLQGNGDGFFASMIPVDNDWYGIMAACDSQLFGRWIFIDGLGLVFCGDSFGSFNGVPVETLILLNKGGWVTRIDIFYDTSDGYPEWNYDLFYEWEIEQ